jgi:hypothetical protein
MQPGDLWGFGAVRLKEAIKLTFPLRGLKEHILMSWERAKNVYKSVHDMYRWRFKKNPEKVTSVPRRKVTIVPRK